MNAILYGQIVVAMIGLALGAALVWWYAVSRHTAHLTKVVAAAKAGQSPLAMASPTQSPEPTMPELQKEAREAEVRYQQAIQEAVGKFSQDLGATSQLINEQIKRMSVDIISQELEAYRADIDKLRQEAATTLGQVTTAVAEERQKLQQSMEADVEAEKERRLAEFDAKLGEAVSSFLLETLKHNVDLGAQSTYLMATLEEHKAELLAEVKDV
jgi:hypothetical protein